MSENAAIVPIRSTVAAARSGDPSLQEMIIRVGRVTRDLHDSLRELRLDVLIEKAAHAIPDTRDRLDYVARMTEQAASRVLNATEAAGPLQDSIDAGAARIADGWRDVLAATAQRSEYRAMAASSSTPAPSTSSSAARR